MAEARDTARVLALAWEGTRKRSISNNSAKRRRASKAKVKTGCRTCKIRRVKCDETKPFCNRCRKFGRGCDGYEADEPPSDEPEKTPQVAKFRPLLKKRVLPITTQPAIQVFHTGEEFRCFQLYCEDAAPRLSGVLGGSLWCRLLLQAGHDQPFIQHAIFTIGALSKMLKGGGLGQFKIETTNPTTSDDILMKKYHGFALWHYDKFIQGTRSHILNGEQGRRMALIACLLVVCIESLQNHAEAALRHARAGTELMHEFLIANTVVPTDSAEEEVIEWNGNLKALPGISSPAPHIIEDELVQQFNRLHMQNLAVFDFQAPEEHSRLKREGTRTIRVMPIVFSNTDDARLFLELITRRSYHYMSERLLTQHIAVGNLMNNTSTFSDEDSDSAITTPKSIDDSPFRQDQVQIEHEIYHSENRRWSQAFEPLFRETQLKPSHPEALSASLLKIHSLALNIRLASHITSSELIYDKFLPEFRQMIDLGKALLQQVEQRIFDDGSFIFDMGLTYDLSLVQLSCRDRRLRREALALLSGKNWKEGSWGSKTCADIASYIMEVEEEGVETDYIPEEARARLIGCEVDVENRRATLRVVQGTGEKRRFRSCTRDWSSMF